ncbi:MAG: flavodoxin family protein [Desulfobacteraceae bacterium]|nr:flavodoxin family protein [Desulfobacteraceae bacterium]
MKTILGLLGSPRRLGNCEIMVKEIARRVDTPHQLNLLRLPEFEIQSCRGCYRCLMEGQRCPLEDDFYRVLAVITAADALVVAAPTYFLGANGCLKRFLDRGLARYDHTESLWGKPAVGIGIAGIRGKEGGTLLDIERFLKLLLADVRGVRMAFGALPGEVFLNGETRDTVSALAAALFGPPLLPTGPSCLLCGGTTFRFLGGDRVQCQLCSNTGTFRVAAGVPVFEIPRSAHELFLTRADVEHHKKWLLGMKARFLEKKTELKQITLPYLKEGQWIQPEGK